MRHIHDEDDVGDQEKLEGRVPDWPDGQDHGDGQRGEAHGA